MFADSGTVVKEITEAQTVVSEIRAPSTEVTVAKTVCTESRTALTERRTVLTEGAEAKIVVAEIGRMTVLRETSLTTTNTGTIM